MQTLKWQGQKLHGRVEITYMIQKVQLPFRQINPSVPFPADYLEYNNAKAENVGLDREKSV